MTLRVSHGSQLAPYRARRGDTQSLALPASSDEVIRAVCVVDATHEDVLPAPHVLPRGYAQAAEPKQLARAAEAYAQAQDDLRSYAVGRYLRVQA